MENQGLQKMSKNKCVRYKPEGKNFSNRRYSGFRNGISFGKKRQAQKFIKRIRKQGVYNKFRIKKIKC